jgi:hypothetical protein
LLVEGSLKKLVALPSALLVLLVLITRTGAAQSQLVHAPDGGTRETIASIFVPPLPNAPFSATVNTDWTRYLEDGATRFIRNHRAIARDGQGRVFQERRFFAAPGSPNESRLMRTEIADPVRHTLAYCDPYQHLCELRFYAAMLPAALPPAGSSPNGARNVTRESLGTQTINGLETVGTREVQALSAAIVGTDRPVTKRSDPQSGLEVFTVTDIDSSEPDPGLFALPNDARVADLRGRTPR